MRLTRALDIGLAMRLASSLERLYNQIVVRCPTKSTKMIVLCHREQWFFTSAKSLGQLKLRGVPRVRLNVIFSQLARGDRFAERAVESVFLALAKCGIFYMRSLINRDEVGNSGVYIYVYIYQNL